MLRACRTSDRLESHRRMRAGEPFALGRFAWPAKSEARVLMPDRLHPTLEGLAGVTHMVVLELVERGLVPAEAVRLDLPAVLVDLGVEAALEPAAPVPAGPVEGGAPAPAPTTGDG